MYNKSTNFLLPVLRLPKSIFELGFVNVYLDDNGLNHNFKNCLFVLFKYPKEEEFQEQYIQLEDKLRARADYVADYLPHSGYGMFIFEFPEEFYFEYEQFKKGKYSTFRTEEFCVRFYGKTSSMYKICTKNKKWWNEEWGRIIGVPPPDGEFHSKPILEEEIYRYEEDGVTEISGDNKDDSSIS